MILLIAAAALVLGSPPGGEEILKRVEAVFAAVEDYTVTLNVVTDIERVKIPPMHLTMYYKRPDKVHFDSEGMVILPREGLALPFSKLSQRFHVDSVQTHMENGEKLQKLVVRSRDERARLRRAVLYVDPDRWTPVKVLAHLPDGGSMTASFRFERYGEYWMPVQLQVRFVSAVRDSAAPAAPPGQSPFGDPSPSGTRFVPSRAGTITVQYSGYRINTGLSDDIFAPVKK